MSRRRYTRAGRAGRSGQALRDHWEHAKRAVRKHIAVAQDHIDMARRTWREGGAPKWYVLGYKEPGPRARLGLVSRSYASERDAQYGARAMRADGFIPRVRLLTPRMLQKIKES